MNEEREVSPSMLCKDRWIVIGIPLCNICVYRYAPNKCEKMEYPPEEYRRSIRRDCKYVKIAKDSLLLPRFSELYPEDTERLLKKQEKSSNEKL